MTTITVPAPKIEVGDRIDRRTVRAVSGRRPRTVSNAHAHTPGRTNGLKPVSTFVGHVVVVWFTDDGAPKHYWGEDTVEVERGAGAAEAA